MTATTIEGDVICPTTAINNNWAGRARRAIVFFLAAATFSLSFAGTCAEAADSYLYLSVGGEDRVAIYRVDADTGDLQAKGSVDVDGPPGAMAVDPGRTFLYVGVRKDSGSVAVFRIDPKSGGLTPVGSTALIADPVYLAIDHTGKYLLMSSYGAGQAAVYARNDDGTIGERPTHTVRTDKNPHSILMDPSNQFVFVPNTGAHVILQYRFDRDAGRLLRNSPAKVATEEGAGPRHMWFHPSLNVVYFVNETNSSVSAFDLDPLKGTLTQMQNLSTLPEGYTEKSYCADIEVTPSGKFVYASNRGHDSIAGFAVDPSTGKLTLLGQTPTETWPRSFNIDPTGRFLYSAGQNSNKLIAYRMDGDTGALEPLKVYEVGKSPSWVQVVEMPSE